MPPHSQIASLNPRRREGYPTTRHRQEPGASDPWTLSTRPHSGPSDPHPASRARGGVPDADAGREMRCSSGSHPRTTRDIRRAFTAAAARIQPPPPSPPKSPRSSHSPPPSPTTGNCHRYLFRPRSAQASRSSVAEQRSVGAALQIRARRHADLRSPDGERTECRHCSRPRASSRELFRWGGDRV
jgi:hypothetical protein